MQKLLCNFPLKPCFPHSSEERVCWSKPQSIWPASRPTSVCQRLWTEHSAKPDVTYAGFTSSCKLKAKHNSYCYCTTPGTAHLDGLQTSLKNVRQKIPPNDQTRLKFGFSYENFTTQSFSVLPTPFLLNVSWESNKTNVSPVFQRHRLCDGVSSTLADEFGDFGAVFGTALKERNQTFGYKKHGGVSAYRKAFLIFWRWIFKEKTEEIWSWLFFTTWISWILNFIIKFTNAFTSTLAILAALSGRQSRAVKIQPFLFLHQ